MPSMTASRLAARQVATRYQYRAMTPILARL